MKLVKCTAVAALIAALTLGNPPIGAARGGHAGYHGGWHSRHSSRIHRSREEKHQFEVMTGHPHGWPGHVVDHIIPLACGGADAPSNMQWETVADGKAKDKWERKGCKK